MRERFWGLFWYPSNPSQVYLQGFRQQVWCVHICSSEPLAHSLCHRCFPLMLADRLSLLSQPGKAVHEVLVLNPDYRWWSLWTSFKESHFCWEGVSAPVHWQSWWGGTGEGDPAQVMQPRTTEWVNEPIILPPYFSSKPVKEQHIKGRLLKNIIVCKNTFECLI